MAFKTIKPKKQFNPRAIKNKMRKVVKEQAEHSNKQFELTYKTWSHKPEFIEDFKETVNQMIGSATTTDKGSSDNPYPFIARGTSVRYATMTDNFSPKSRPRIIGSSAGKGGLLYVDTNRPRPGIKSREFENEIAKREQPKFAARFKRALSEIAEASGHSI